MTDVAQLIEQARALPPWPILARQHLVAYGCRLVEVGDRRWFTERDWLPDSVIGLKRRTAYIGLLAAATPDRGAFSRLLSALKRERLTPAVVAPLGRMTAILERKGFAPAVEVIGDEPVDVWRGPA